MHDISDLILFKRTAKTCFVLRLTVPGRLALQAMLADKEPFQQALQYVVSVVPGCSLMIKKKSLAAATKEYAARAGAEPENIKGREYFGRDLSE